MSSIRFEILEIIGEGSFGKVFKINDILDNKLVAMKTINLKGKYKIHINVF